MKRHLTNLPLRIVVLNHGETRFQENLKPLPYCINVIIFSSLHYPGKEKRKGKIQKQGCSRNRDRIQNFKAQTSHIFLTWFLFKRRLSISCSEQSKNRTNSGTIPVCKPSKLRTLDNHTLHQYLCRKHPQNIHFDLVLQSK